MIRVALALWLALGATQVVAADGSAAAVPSTNGPALYREHCASCHGEDRFGGMGPALLPSNLERLRKPAAEKVIAEGRIATQMQGFADRLKPEEIKALAAYIYSPPSKPPIWDFDAIRRSRIVHARPEELADKPTFDADPLNLFVVVEGGDHHVTILDGDRFEPLARFPSRYALHGGPKFSPDGRFVYFASRDGWISKYDLWSLKLVAEIRAGLNARNAAVSSDGRYVLVGNYLPHTVVVLDAADLAPIKVIPAVDAKGRSSRVSAVYDAAPRRSFIVALKDVPELWEISYDDKAAPIYAGLVHDYRLGEGVAVPGKLNPRRTPLEDVLDDFFFTPDYAYVIGAMRGKAGADGNDRVSGQVVNLDVRRKVADIPLPGMPHLGSGISWTYNGSTVMATPNLKEGVVSVIDVKTWKVIRHIAIPGPGFFMRSHEKSRYAWVDSMMSPSKDTLTVIDKETLASVASVRPVPGKTLAHIEFTRDGRYALASLWEDDGALIVFDARTLREVKRLPMRKPVGKYNVYNKITRSEGTSH